MDGFRVSSKAVPRSGPNLTVTDSKRKSNPTLSHSCCHPKAYNVYTSLYGDKCSCGLWFGWAFRNTACLHHCLCVSELHLSSSLCACCLCLSVPVCGKSASSQTKMQKYNVKPQSSWMTLVWGEWTRSCAVNEAQDSVTHRPYAGWHMCKPPVNTRRC